MSWPYEYLSLAFLVTFHFTQEYGSTFCTSIFIPWFFFFLNVHKYFWGHTFLQAYMLLFQITKHLFNALLICRDLQCRHAIVPLLWKAAERTPIVCQHNPSLLSSSPTTTIGSSRSTSARPFLHLFTYFIDSSLIELDICLTLGGNSGLQLLSPT